MSSPAAASVDFQFSQTGSTPPGSVIASGFLSISDAAFQAGLNVGLDEFNSDFSGTGIEGIQFSTLHDGEFLLSNFVPRPPGSVLFWGISLFSRPGGIPTGVVRFTDLSDENSAEFFLGNPQSTGDFASDNPAIGCFLQCTFTGTWGTGLFLPEPPTLELLLVAVAGLIASRMRKSGAKQQ
jgi:hypothetical protein